MAKDCTKCIHNAVCKTAESCDGCVSGCKHFKEEKRGRWKGAGLGDYLCSECWEQISGGDRFNYCPNCGAKMDGDGNG